MINKTLTGISISNYNTLTDLPSAITDTFITKSEINITTSLSLINSLTGISINSGNIETFKLYIRIYNPSNLNTILDSMIFDLNTSNIINSFLFVNIKNFTDLYDNEKILSSMIGDEYRKLYKKYKLVIRLYTGSLTNSNEILNTDISQDINFVINTFESGPYDVAYDNIDVCNPNDFSPSERNNIFIDNPQIVGVESIRSFYSENCLDLMPLIVYVHGNNQSSEGFDSFLSHFASYGYFGISLNVDPGADVVPNTYYILKLINHLKNNITKIKSGQFSNKIDFNKIILCGLSRGGLMIETIAGRLKYKNTTFSQFSGNNLNIEYSDLKCIVSIGDVNTANVLPDGRLTFEGKFAGQIHSPTVNELQYYAVNHDIPLVKILGFNDNQQSSLAIAHSLFYPGFCYTNQINYIDKYVLFSYGAHNDLVDRVNPAEEKIFAVNRNLRYLDEYNFNSNYHPLNEFKSTLLYFFSSNIFNSNKLKKLRFISPKKQRINYITKDDSLNSVYHIFFPKNDDILYHIDVFSGITSSLAGVTGFTFNSPLGYTYDFCVDSCVYNEPTAIDVTVNQIYLDALKELKILPSRHTGNFRSIASLEDNDTFNGVLLNSYRSLYVPIESNISFGYTLPNQINLSENCYIGLKASQVYKFNTPTTNSKNANFNLTLIDKNNNFSTISSKNYSDGFYKQIETTISPTNPSTSNAKSDFPSLSNFVFFRAGDFYVKNQSLDLSNINKLRLDFGPDYGSTFSHIAFDSFVVYKEL